MNEKIRSTIKSAMPILIGIAVPVIIAVCIDLFSHNHDMAQKVIKEATCTEKGKIKHYCKTCDYSYEESINALEHDYDKGTVVLEATCTTPGTMEMTCKRCKDKKSEEIKAGHKMTENVIKEATCTQDGKKESVCSVCGYSETKEIEKTRHSFSNKVCIYCGALDASSISSDTWLNKTGIDYLTFKNCLVTEATPIKKGMLVTYYPVCRSCHVASTTMQLGAPEFNYDVTKNYICPYCDEMTVVQLKMTY